jgi:hypothetical protein
MGMFNNCILYATFGLKRLSTTKRAIMKQISSLAFICFLLFSCNKPGDVPISLNGVWRMIKVKENNSGVISTKPSSLQREVEISITMKTFSAGIFTGVTPTNQITENNFFVDTKQSISIPVLGMTKVSETPWGDEFVSNIREAKQYYFDADGVLNIITRFKTLSFQKQ